MEESTLVSASSLIAKLHVDFPSAFWNNFHMYNKTMVAGPGNLEDGATIRGEISRT
jgi:hypothetical protein